MSLFKKTTNNNIPIFLASDDNYSPYLCTTMYSILKHTKSRIDFYVLDNNISENSKELIINSLKKFKNFTVEYLNVEKFNLNQFPDIRHYSTTAFARYFIPTLKPELKKVIYLDVDIIVKKDIKDLFNTDLGKYPLGAILEDFYAYNYKYLKSIYPLYYGEDKYFNSGVLLIDIEKWKEKNYTQTLIEKTKEYFDKLNTADQDVFNMIFQNNFKILDYKYNFMPDLYDYLEKKHLHLAKKTKRNPAIIHYVSMKPWKATSIANKYFWQIANKTKFGKILKNNFKERSLARKFFLLKTSLFN